MDDRETPRTRNWFEKRRAVNWMPRHSPPARPPAFSFCFISPGRSPTHLPPAPASPPLASLYGPHGSAARPSYPKNGILSNPASLVAYHSYQKLTLEEFSLSFGMLYTVNCRLYWLCWSMLLCCCGHITRSLGRPLPASLGANA